MHKVQWIIFDVGGVLLDWRSSSTALAKELGVSQERLLDALFKYAPLMNTGKISSANGWGRILYELDKTDDPLTIIRKWRAPEFWIKPTLNLIKDLHISNYRLAVLTNSWLGLTDPAEQKFLPAEIKLFNHILDSSQYKIKKPSIEFYKLAESILGAKSSQIYFIDDDKSNLKPADKLGWHTHHFHLNNDKGETSTKDIRGELRIA